MTCSVFRTITRHNTADIQDFTGGLQVNNLLGQPQNRQNGNFSHFSYSSAKAYEFQEHRAVGSPAHRFN